MSVIEMKRCQRLTAGNAFMPQPDDDARGRLQRSALDLFREWDYASTKAAKIAARAGFDVAYPSLPLR